MIDPVELLARDDKWQLGAGDGVLFAPSVPQWLDTPGCWDGLTLYDRVFAPLFTITILDDEGRELTARAAARRWTPAELTLQYRLGQGITASEVRTMHPGGVFVSEWRFAAYKPTRIHLVAWTAQPGEQIESGSVAYEGALTFVRALDTAAEGSVRAELAVVGGAASWSARRSAESMSAPLWPNTPFADWRRGALSKDVGSEPVTRDGTFFAAVHRALDVEYGGASAAFAMRIVPAERSLLGEPPREPVAPRHGTIGGTSRKRWGDFFASVPEFRCSDPYFEMAYWHRWYALQLNAVRGAKGAWSGARACEGPGLLHRPSALSAHGLVSDLRWSNDGEWARGALTALLAAQRTDGSIPSVLAFGKDAAAAAAPARCDVGGALAALDELAPDDTFLAECYEKLARYTEWLRTAADADATGLFDLDRAADGYGARAAGRTGRVKAVDATVDAYRLFRHLERSAARVSFDDVERWRTLADATRDAMRERMWSDRSGSFNDLDAESGEPTGVLTSAAFLPLGTDIAEPLHRDAMVKHLLDPAMFATTYPVPTLALNDPRFSADGVWEGRRALRPTNGRVWPLRNAPLIDALAAAARTMPHDSSLRDAAAALLRRHIRMLFANGDLRRVSGFEHYHPFTGRGSAYRGVDDVPHGALVDLLVRHVLGVGVRDDTIVVDPLPFGLEHAEGRGLRVCGRTIDVIVSVSRVTLTIDGETRDAELGEPIVLPIDR
jgi:hypothetical protein